MPVCACYTVLVKTVLVRPTRSFGVAVLTSLLIPGLGALLPPTVTPPSPGPAGPEGAPLPNGPLLAPARSPGLGKSIDGIKCETHEQVLFHIHVHLTIFIGGQPVRVPLGIGIGPPTSGTRTPVGAFATSGSCFSWLHTHADDGIIHIESPLKRVYTLGNFFDLWALPLGPGQVGPAFGHVSAFLNGEPFTGNPRAIPLTRHAQIQLDVGIPIVLPTSIEFTNGL